jgi:hypothetical protein
MTMPRNTDARARDPWAVPAEAIPAKEMPAAHPRDRLEPADPVVTADILPRLTQ